MELDFNTLSLPDSPGIYLFYNGQKELIYVGKATSLKNRVRSYWRIKRVTRPIEAMMHEVVLVKHKTTGSVLEAVILEANCIKTYLPKYNVLGKDNRSWNYIIITEDEYPQVKTLRQYQYEVLGGQPKADQPASWRAENRGIEIGVKYIFGPYPGLNTRAALKILRSLFRFYSCTPGQSRPCLYYQMGECLGVCARLISPAEYKEKVIRPLVLFLKGQKKKLVKELEQKMKINSREENYEEAGRLRDQLKSLYRIQDITLINREMVGYSLEEIKKQRNKETGGFGLSIKRIEGYDISNLGSSGKVGSMVVFDSAGPVKSEYRKFKIKTVAGQSDVDSLEEVIRRRFQHSEWPYPDVILIDGGRPQVNRVEEVLRSLHIFVPLVGIAKGPERKKNDFVFPLSLFENTVRIARDIKIKRREFVHWVNENQNLLIRVRDEAHRFAIFYQRKIRGKNFLK